MNFTTLINKKNIVLHSKGLTDDDLLVLAQVLKKTKVLKSLYLSRNQITLGNNQNGKLFTYALAQNKTLTSLYLGWNTIGRDGIHKLSTALKFNKTLTKLGLEHNNICSRGCKLLANALSVNKSLFELGLRSNNIDDYGVRYLGWSLVENNESLRVLELRGNGDITAIGARILKRVLEYNCVIENIDLGTDDTSNYNHLQIVLQKALDDPNRKLNCFETTAGYKEETLAVAPKENASKSAEIAVLHRSQRDSPIATPLEAKPLNKKTKKEDYHKLLEVSRPLENEKSTNDETKFLTAANAAATMINVVTSNDEKYISSLSVSSANSSPSNNNNHRRFGALIQKQTMNALKRVYGKKKITSTRKE